MGVISYVVPINAQRMTIGVQGENNVRQFLFDVTEWRQITGDIGAAEMVVQRNGDSSPYATVITMQDENTVSWVPTETDTAKVGVGKIQLMWIASGQTVKTKIFDMKVDPALDYQVPDDSLDPWASWMPGIINADANYKVLTSRVNNIQQSLTSPYNFCGSVASLEALPETAEINDTYYVEDVKYRVTWTGDAFEQSSMSEDDYMDELAISLKRIVVSSSTAESTYGRSAANLPIHSYAYISRSWFDDMDGTAGSEGHIITLGQADRVGKMQVYITPYSGGNVFVRIKNYSTQIFGSWYPVFRLDTTLAVTGKAADAKATGDAIEAAKNLALKYLQVTASTAESDYGGLSANLPVRTFSFVSKSWFGDMDNVLGSEGYIISLGHSETVGKEQIYISPYGSSHIYMRAINSGTAGPWLTPEKTASGAVYYAYGDSVTRGQIGQWSGDTSYSSRGYPYVISRRLDMTLKQKAVGGQGLIKDWNAINTSIDSTDLSDASLITVGWAYNDYEEYRNLPMGSYTDTDTSTVIGYYYSIMAKLQAKAPMARLVLVTGYGYSDGTISPQKKPTLTSQFSHSYPFSGGSHTVQEFYNELEKMCWLYGWGCVNQAKGCAFNRFNASTVIGDQIHPTDDGYALYGNSIANRVLAYYANIYI